MLVCICFIPCVDAISDRIYSDYYEEDNEESKNEKQRSRLEKRKRALEKITDLRDEFFSGGWDGWVLYSNR